MDPHGFSRITRVKRDGSTRNLQYPRVDQFDTYCEISSRCHVRSSSYDVICQVMFGRNGARSCFPAYEYEFHENLLVFMDV